MKDEFFTNVTGIDNLEIFMIEDAEGYHYTMSADIKIGIMPIMCDAIQMYTYAPSRWKRFWWFVKFNIVRRPIWWVQDLFRKDLDDDDFEE